MAIVILTTMGTIGLTSRSIEDNLEPAEEVALVEFNEERVVLFVCSCCAAVGESRVRTTGQQSP